MDRKLKFVGVVDQLEPGKYADMKALGEAIKE